VEFIIAEPLNTILCYNSSERPYRDKSCRLFSSRSQFCTRWECKRRRWWSCRMYISYRRSGTLKQVHMYTANVRNWVRGTVQVELEHLYFTVTNTEHVAII